jgi:hypothetical protein
VFPIEITISKFMLPVNVICLIHLGETLFIHMYIFLNRGGKRLLTRKP